MPVCLSVGIAANVCDLERPDECWRQWRASPISPTQSLRPDVQPSAGQGVLCGEVNPCSRQRSTLTMVTTSMDGMSLAARVGTKSVVRATARRTYMADSRNIRHVCAIRDFALEY